MDNNWILFSLIMSAVLFWSAIYSVLYYAGNALMMMGVVFSILLGILSFIWAKVLSFLSVKSIVKLLSF